MVSATHLSPSYLSFGGMATAWSSLIMTSGGPVPMLKNISFGTVVGFFEKFAMCISVGNYKTAFTVPEACRTIPFPIELRYGAL